MPGPLQLVEKPDRVRAKEEGDHDCEAREVPLDNVLAALRSRREAKAAEARVPTRVHEYEGDEDEREQHLGDWKDYVEHMARIAKGGMNPAPTAARPTAPPGRARRRCDPS